MALRSRRHQLLGSPSNPLPNLRDKCLFSHSCALFSYPSSPKRHIHWRVSEKQASAWFVSSFLFLQWSSNYFGVRLVSPLGNCVPLTAGDDDESGQVPNPQASSCHDNRPNPSRSVAHLINHSISIFANKPSSILGIFFKPHNVQPSGHISLDYFIHVQ